MPQRPALSDERLSDDRLSDDTVKHDPLPDETVRMRTDGPAPDGGPAQPDLDDADETRPVTRDWLLGAPEAGRTTAPTGSPAEPVSDDWTTEAFDRTSAAGIPVDEDDDATTTLGAVPDEDDDGPGSPGGPPPGDEPPGADARGPWWRRRAVLVPAGAVAVLAAVYGADLLISSGDVPRSTVVAGVDIGGLSPAAAATALEKQLAPRVQADRTMVADDVKASLDPAAAGLSLDIGRTVAAADQQPLNPWTRLTSLFGDREVAPVLAIDQDALSTQLDTVAAQVNRAAVDATIHIEGTTPSVVEPAAGRTLDQKGATRAITAALASAGDPKKPIQLPVDVAKVRVDKAAAQRALDETVTPALSAPVGIQGSDGTKAQVPVSAIAAALTFTPKDDGSLAVTVDPAKLQAAMGDHLAVFGTPAKDAHFQVSGDTVTVVPSVDGTGIAPDHLAQQLMSVLTRPAPRTLTAELGPIPAGFTTEQAKSLGIVEKVSSFTTNFTMTPSATNIRVIAEKVNGAVVKPGETFSLNGFTGTRGTAQGYVPANVIEGGQLAKAVGGGISQFATTMFNAVFFAGLQDVHHKTHSFYISRYPAGREATVFDGLIDLAWKNDTDTGIYVQTQWVSGGSITVTFWGTKHVDIESQSGDRRNVTQPSVQEKPDDGTCIPQSGSAGFDITVTRVFKDLKSGAELRSEKFNTHYIPEAVIHCVPAAPTTPAGTTPAGTGGTGGRLPAVRMTGRTPLDRRTQRVA
ncbi:MAG TPA: VanW family protein [Blastococcus sp.]|jgi:vancomycin resistance protein YoaR|nr:VanW family protein [Blastococcus sp.]